MSLERLWKAVATVGMSMSSLDAASIDQWGDLLAAAHEVESDMGALRARLDAASSDAAEPRGRHPIAEACPRPSWAHVADEQPRASLVTEASAIAEAACSRTADISRLLGDRDLTEGIGDTVGHEPKFSRLPEPGQIALIKRVVGNPELLWETARRLSETSL